MMFDTDSCSRLLTVTMVNATGILAIGVMTSWLLRQHSAALRHRVWTLSLLAVLLLPLGLCSLPRLGPEWPTVEISSAASEGSIAADSSLIGLNVTSPDESAIFENDVVKTAPSVVQHRNRPRLDSSISGRGIDDDAGVKTEMQLASSFKEVTVVATPRKKIFAERVRAAAVYTWLAGIAIGLLRLARCQVVTWRLVRTAVPISDKSTSADGDDIWKTIGVLQRVPLLCSPSAIVPLTLGTVRPVIVLPAGYGQWDKDRRHMVLAHEMAHVLRRDVLTQWIARFACVFYWCNPLVWFAYWRSRVEREHACDDVVLLEFEEKPTQYADQLVNVAAALANRSLPSVCGVAMASKSQLEQRVHAILNPRLRRTRVTRTMGRALGAATLVVVVTLSLLSPSSSQSQGSSQANATAPEKTATNDPVTPETQSKSGDSNADAKTTGDMTLVTGAVVDEKNQAVPRATVTASYIDGEASAITDTDGHFTLEIPNERIRGRSLHAEGPNGALGFKTLPWEISPGQAVTAPMITLRSPREIRVRVVGENNEPASDVRVLANADYVTIANATTTADGRATLLVPQNATLQFVLADAGSHGVDYFLFRHPGNPKSDPYQLTQDHSQEISMKLSPTRSLTIRAMDPDGNPIEGASVHPWYIELPRKGGDANLGGLWHAETDSKGRASFENIPLQHERKLTIWVRKDGYVADERTMVDVKVAEQEITAKLLSLVPVKGRVVHNNGAPAEGMKVVARGDSYRFDSFDRETVTAVDGSFRIDVAPQTYCLFVAGDDKRWASAVEARTVLGDAINDIELVLQPARRVFGRLTVKETNEPVEGEYISLYQKEGQRYYYYDLPEEKRLPNPTDSHRAITPRIVKSTHTQPNGSFEFFTGPGSYYLIGPEGMEPPKFDVADNAVEVNVEAPQPVTGTLHGRVVLESDREQGVSELTVFGYPLGDDGRHLRATSANDGTFETQVSRLPQLVGVFSEDRTLGSVMRMEAGAKELLLPVQPTAVLDGTLVFADSGLPAANEEIGASIEIKFDNGTFTSAFRRSATTDEDGRFTIAGIVPAHEYKLDVVMDRDNDGRARSWRTVGTTTAEKAGQFDVGKLELKLSRPEPTLDDYIARAFKDQDQLADRLAQRLSDAKLTYQQVLLFVSKTESTATRQFFEARYDYDSGNRGFRSALANFIIVGVDAGQTDYLGEVGVSVPEPEAATLAILDEPGKRIVEASSLQLETDGALDRGRLTEFLKTRNLPLPDAREELASALAKAGQEDKRVLVQISGPGCAPCVLLSRYLHSQNELLEMDYIYTKIDSRMTHAEEVINKLRLNNERGIPWMTVLSANGDTLITSDADPGNIGFPSNQAGRLHFEKMIRSTRQRLTDQEVESFLAPLAPKLGPAVSSP